MFRKYVNGSRTTPLPISSASTAASFLRQVAPRVGVVAGQLYHSYLYELIFYSSRYSLLLPFNGLLSVGTCRFLFFSCPILDCCCSLCWCWNCCRCDQVAPAASSPPTCPHCSSHSPSSTRYPRLISHFPCPSHPNQQHISPRVSGSSQWTVAHRDQGQRTGVVMLSGRVHMPDAPKGQHANDSIWSEESYWSRKH